MWARRALVAIVGLGAIESVAAALAARDPSPAAWPELAAALDARDDADPVFVAQDWLGPSARLAVPESAYLPSVARPDLHGIGRFHTIGWGDDGSAAIARDLEGLPAPTREAERSFGPLVWATWRSPAAGTVIESLTAPPRGVQVSSDAGSCRGRAGFRCPEGAVGSRIIEVDFRPRACLATEVSDGTTVRLVWPSARLGDALRGHIGMGDYNARLRNDAPVLVVIRIAGTEALRTTVTDQQGWWAFDLPTTPGIGSIEVELTAGLSGVFAGTTYDGTPTRATCIELRTIGRSP